MLDDVLQGGAEDGQPPDSANSEQADGESLAIVGDPSDTHKVFAWAKHEVERKTGGSLVQLPAEFVLRPDHIVDVLLPRLAVTFDADAQMIRKGDRVGLNKEGKLILSDAPIGIAMSNAAKGEIVAVQMLSYPVMQVHDEMVFDRQGDHVLGLREATIDYLETALQKEAIAAMNSTIQRMHEMMAVPVHLLPTDPLSYEFKREVMGSWVDPVPDPIGDIRRGIKSIKGEQVNIRVQRGERVQIRQLTDEDRMVRLLLHLGIVERDARELLTKFSFEELSKLASQLRTLSTDLEAQAQSLQETKQREQHEHELRELEAQYAFEHSEVTRKLRERRERLIVCENEESDEPGPWKDW